MFQVNGTQNCVPGDLELAAGAQSSVGRIAPGYLTRYVPVWVFTSIYQYIPPGHDRQPGVRSVFKCRVFEMVNTGMGISWYLPRESNFLELAERPALRYHYSN